MLSLMNPILIGSAVSAIAVCCVDEVMFEHIGTRQIDYESITELVADYPDANHCVAGTAEGQACTYSLQADHEEDDDPLPFDQCERIARLSGSSIAFLSRESPIAWKHSSQTGKRLRRKQDSAASANALICHPESGTMTIGDTDGLSVWSTESLEVIWVPNEMPAAAEPLSLFDATADYLVAGNTLGDVWKITPNGSAERIRNSEYSNDEPISSKELSLLDSVMINLVARNSTSVATVIRCKHGGYVEWWSCRVGQEKQPREWIKVKSLPLTMDFFEAVPYGNGEARCIYVSSKTSICFINLKNQDSHICVAIPQGSSPISSFSVSKDQARILTGHEDGSVKTWRKGR
jgi:hypothetical protein